MCNIRVTVVLTLAIILVILRILGQKGCPYDSPHRLRGDDGGITQLLIFWETHSACLREGFNTDEGLEAPAFFSLRSPSNSACSFSIVADCSFSCDWRSRLASLSSRIFRRRSSTDSVAPVGLSAFNAEGPPAGGTLRLVSTSRGVIEIWTFSNAVQGGSLFSGTV